MSPGSGHGIRTVPGGSGRRLVAVFALTMVLPGFWLALFGLRSLRQERQVAEQQVRERLERAAEAAERAINARLQEWDQAVEQAAGSPPVRLRPLVEARGLWYQLHSGAGGTPALPGSILYFPNRPPNPVPLRSDTVAQAEKAELSKDYAAAVALYRKALGNADLSGRAELIHRLARTERKAGNSREAIRLYTELRSLPAGRAGGLPAELVARYELCTLWAEAGANELARNAALELYRDLVKGRWMLAKHEYFYYSEKALEWAAGTDPAELEKLRAEERRKLGLTAALESFLESPRRIVELEGNRFVCFSAGDGLNRPAKAHAGPVLILPWDALWAALQPDITRAVADSGLDATISADDPASMMGAHIGAPLHAGADQSASRRIERLDGPWRLRVAFREPERALADVNARQRLYVATLLMMAALLAFGTYLLFRMIRHEAAVARLKSEFVAAVSHEFRSPLTAIRQLSELFVAGRVKNEERRGEFYRMLDRESRRLTRLVENLLDFSRIEEGRKRYKLEPVETSEWLRSVAGELDGEAREKSIALRVNVAAGLPALLADAEALGCAVHNLLDNAIKYSAKGAEVELEAAADDGTVSIFVRDRGRGIPAAELPHIFEKFYRVRGEAADEVKGVGLGLALVKHIVTAHGGSVDCESQVGGGSTFRIRLPQSHHEDTKNTKSTKGEASGASAGG
jgi:signal transduction histidine kinase